MNPSWSKKKEVKIRALQTLKLLDESLSLSPNGGIGILDPDYKTMLDILTETLVFSSGLIKESCYRLVKEAVFSCVSSRDVTEETFIKELEQAYKKRQAIRVKSFHLLTQISLPGLGSTPDAVLPMGTVRFYKTRPDVYVDSGLAAISKYQNEMTTTMPSHSWAVAEITAKDSVEAIEVGVKAISLLCCIWNMHLRTYGAIHLGNVRENQIVAGPYYTLHETTGAGISIPMWINPTYRELVPNFNSSQRLTRLRRDEKIWLGRLPRLTYSKKITELLVRYDSALDETNPAQAFTSIWSVLEELTGASNANYDGIIRRASFVYLRSSESKLFLQHMRESRNRIVHDGEDFGPARNLVTMIIRITDRILGILRKQCRRFESFEDFGNFLDLSVDKKQLEKEIALRALALRVIR